MNELIPFTKMEGVGNDYVYINEFVHPLQCPSDLARKISDRHTGVGSDGLILISPGTTSTIQMKMYNADGSLSEMCGNGLRCVAKFVYEKGITRDRCFTIQTGAGNLTVQVFPNEDDHIDLVEVDMGSPILEGKCIPSLIDLPTVVEYPFILEQQTLLGTLVSMGNPHFVSYVEQCDDFPIEKFGPLIETDALFPNRINVEFVQILNRKEVRQRTWERGSGETLACGTGACAVAVAGVLTGKTDLEIKINLRGGDLFIRYDEKQKRVFMKGPTREVFTGFWPAKN